MDEEIDRLVVGVQADISGFQRGVAEMRAALDGPLANSADAAGRSIENALVRAVRSGKLGFEDLKKAALSALGEIAASALKSGLDAIFGGGAAPAGMGGFPMGIGGGTGGVGAILSGATGLPGRATGGPVSPGRAYMVGERGPELFVPTASGQVLPSGGGQSRDVRVAITINAGNGDQPQALARSSRQIARAVRQAIEGAS